MPGEWLAQLPEDLRTNEAFTGHATIGDLAKSHLEAQGKLTEFDGKVKEYDGKLTDLNTKLANSIPKLSDKATAEEQAAYWKAIGRPDKAEEYQFPKAEGGADHDPRMVSWAQETFHKAGLTPSQAAIIGEQWSSFVSEFNKTLLKQEQDALTEESTKLKTELGTEYDAHVELGKRFFKKIMEADFTDEMSVTPTTLLRFVIKAGKLMGEGLTPGGSGTPAAAKPGMVYDKTPGMGAPQ